MMPDADNDLRRARAAVLHSLRNACAIVFSNLDALEVRLRKTGDAEALLILDDMKAGRKRAMDCFDALNNLI